jgi:hypothetical protein
VVVNFFAAEDVGSWDTDFWNRLMTTDDRLVVWFGRHSALESAFFLALSDRLEDRPFDIVDVTDVRSGVVAVIPPNELANLIGSERPVGTEERTAARRRWRRLRKENAPFRVVTPDGLVSAPADHFDSAILEQATKEWQSAARIVGMTMAHNCEPYMQVGDIMLLVRVVDLIDQGKLLAQGEPWDMHACRLRLPD